MPSEVSSFRRQSFFTVTASATFKYKHSFSAAGSSKSALYTAIRIPPGDKQAPGSSASPHPKNDAGRGRRAFPPPSFSWQHISHRVFYLLDGIRPEKSIQYGAVDKVSQQPRFTAKKYGCPAIDPVVIVKYLLVGFLYGIPSERQIERRIQADIALRWYLGFDRVPDHSTVSQLRRRQPSGLLPSKGTV